MVILTIWWYFVVGGSHVGPTHPWRSLCGAYVARKRLVDKENDIKQSLPHLAKRSKRHFWSIFPKEAKLAPHSNSNLEASLRAFLGAQSIGEKGGSFGNAFTPIHDHIHPHFSPHSKNTLPSSLHSHPLGLFINTYTSPFLWQTFTIPSLNIHLHHTWVRLAINLGDNSKVNHPYIKPNVTHFLHSSLYFLSLLLIFSQLSPPFFGFSLLLHHTSRINHILHGISTQIHHHFHLQAWLSSPLLPSSQDLCYELHGFGLVWEFLLLGFQVCIHLSSFMSKSLGMLELGFYVEISMWSSFILQTCNLTSRKLDFHVC